MHHQVKLVRQQLADANALVHTVIVAAKPDAGLGEQYATVCAAAAIGGETTSHRCTSTVDAHTFEYYLLSDKYYDIRSIILTAALGSSTQRCVLQQPLEVRLQFFF
jgi:hypothetical protein